MSDAPSNHIVLIGLPGTGKTTFLAALWHVVKQKHIPASMQLDKLDEERKYLNDISKCWLECSVLTRNVLDTETVVSMSLKETATGRSIKLFFPDLDGESFRLQWTHRQFTQSYDRFLRQASGAVLFVHPGRVKKPTLIATAELLLEELEGVTEVPSADPEAATPPAPWNPDTSPTQVQLVELLQFIAGREYFHPPFRLAVIISAWDTQALVDQTPQQWLSSRLPLLNQYLHCNRESFDFTLYGVSAQGGGYDEPGKTGDSKELLSKTPAKRIQVVGAGVQNINDITEPLRWLMR
jgi:GTPase SAR1 family protein